MSVSNKFRVSAWAVAVLLALGVLSNVSAQVNPRDIPSVTQPQQRFNSGQDIQPIYEGWVGNDDGTFTFHMGYLNRNYEEQPNVPIGPNNFLSPGPPDRGQPTYFYPRTQRYQFTVTVAADWGPTQELVWQLTHNGSTQYLYAWLQPEWEIDRKNIASIQNLQRGRDNDQLYADVPPEIELSAAPTTVTLPNSVTITARVTDDGLPVELPERPPRRRDPTLQRPDDAPGIPDNIPMYSKPMPERNGLSVQWIVYRGPADVGFELGQDAEGEDVEGFDGWQEGDPGDGRTEGTFTTTATFSEPGTYLIRAVAADGMMLTMAHIEVVVSGTN